MVFSAIQHLQGRRGGPHAIQDVFPGLYLSALNPGAQLIDRLFKTILIIKDHKALHAGPAYQKLSVHPGTQGQGSPVL